MGVLKLVVEYDGTDFAGWQVQPETRTVQGELNRALSVLLRREVRVEGAGRTDAGVHAIGQVATFPGDEDLAAELRSLNGILSKDVVVRSVEHAPDGFHARFSAIRRHYRYRIHRGPTALRRRDTLIVHREIALGPLRQGAARLPGKRDFASLAAGIEPEETTFCDLQRLTIIENGEFLLVEATANRFLRKMVRTIVGTLLEVGCGKRRPEWIDEVLAAEDRSAAGPVVAAHGLILTGVDYPKANAPSKETHR